MASSTKKETVFGIYYFLLWLNGAWPYEENSFSKGFRFYTSVIFQITLAITSGLECLVSTAPFSDLSVTIHFGVGVIMTGVKIVYIYRYREILANVMTHCEEFYKNAEDDHLEILRSRRQLARYEYYIIASVDVFGTTMFVVNSLQATGAAKDEFIAAGANGTFVPVMIYPISYLHPAILTQYFIPIQIFLYVQIFYCVSCYLISDGLFFVLALQIVGQFRILKDNWEKTIDEVVDKSVDVQRKAIRTLTDRHRQLLGFGNDLSTVFNIACSLQMASTLILVIMTGCEALMAKLEKDYSSMLNFMNSMIGIIVGCCIYGVASDYLQEESASVSTAVYSTKWYALDLSVKKDILFSMQGSSMSVAMSAGEFMVVTRNTILQLIKTAFSFLSVFKIFIEQRYEMEQLLV